MRRKLADDGLVDAVLVRKYRNFHAGIIRQIGDRAVVDDVAVKFERRPVAEAGVEDICRIFTASVGVDGLIFNPVRDLLLPAPSALQPAVERKCVQTGVPVRAVRAVVFNQIRPFAEPRIILGIVAAGLGDVIAQMPEHFIAYLLLVVEFRSFQLFCEFRVQILPVVLQLQIERLMVDARTEIVDLVHRRFQPLRQHCDCPLYAVAQTRNLNVCFGLHGLAEHRHGVRVIQENRIRAIFLNIPADIQHQGNIAQRAENTGDAACIADVDIDAKLHGDLNIIAPDVDAAIEDRTQNAVRAGKRLRAALRRGDLRVRAHSGVDLSDCGGDPFEPLRVGVHQRQLTVFKGREREQISDKIAREDKAARADKCKFFHKEHHPFSFLDGSSVSHHLRGGKAENCQISGHSCYTASRPYAILARGDQHESLL